MQARHPAAPPARPDIRLLTLLCATAFYPAVLLGLSPAVQAQKLSVTPAAGLWESSMTIKLNGVDMVAMARAAQAEAMKTMPRQERAMMEQLMQQALGSLGAPECSFLTPEQARVAADLQALLRQMSEDRGGAQECRSELVSVSATP